MCGGTKVEDNSAEVARIQAEQAEAARAAEAAREAQELADFNQRLETSYNNSLDSAHSFFNNQGLDASQYTAQITDAVGLARDSVPSLAGSPNTFFDGVGESVFNDLQNAQRNTALRDFDSFAANGFENDRIAITADDPFVDTLLAEQQSDSTDYLERLLSRGIVTQGGFAAGLADIEDQSFGVKSQIGGIGDSLVQGARGDLREIIADGKTTANSLSLGTEFDPFSFESKLNESQDNFFANLFTDLKGNTPTNLFDTTNLANIAGSFQGAQNTPFSSDILAGFDENVEDDESEEDEFLSF